MSEDKKRIKQLEIDLEKAWTEHSEIKAKLQQELDAARALLKKLEDAPYWELEKERDKVFKFNNVLVKQNQDMESEIDTLREELDAAREEFYNKTKLFTQAYDLLKQRDAQIAEYEGALEWYAEVNNWPYANRAESPTSTARKTLNKWRAK